MTYNLEEAWRVPSSSVHQPVLLLQAVVALYFLAQALVDQKTVSWGFFWLLLTSLYGLQFAETAVGRTFCFVAAGLILILALLESVYAMAFRYGGEEFILLFAGKRKMEVLPYLERLRQIVSEAGFVLRRKNRPRRNPRRKSGNR